MRPDGARAIQRELVALENLLTPRDFLDRARSLNANGDPLGQAMLDSRIGRELGSATHLQPYVAEQISDGATLYLGAGENQRRLLIAFTGRAYRMMMPTAALLQRLPAAEWDVLMLRDPSNQHYRFGCAGMGHSFPRLTDTLMVHAARYPAVKTLGTSMGALAAVRLSLATGLPAIAVGARRPTDVARLFEPGPIPHAFDPVCACLSDGARDLIFVHGALNAEDTAIAQETSALAGGSILAVPEVEIHAVLAELWNAGNLEPALAALLGDGDRDTRLRAAAAIVARAPSVKEPPVHSVKIARRRKTILKKLAAAFGF